MAFQNQFSPEMESSQHFSEQHLYESPSLLRSILPEQLSTQSTRNGIQPENHHHQQLTWLDSGVYRQQDQFVGVRDGSGAIADANFLNMQSNSESSSAAAERASSQWLSRAIAHGSVRDDEVSESRNSITAAGIMHGPPSNFNAVGDGEDYRNTGCRRGGGSAEVAEGGVGGGGSGKEKSEIERYKADISGHPLYEQLLATHVACLRIATPVDQLPRIDSQLAQTHEVIVQKYSAQIGNGNLNGDRELDQFMEGVWNSASFLKKMQKLVTPSF
ncbi:unnamed protein product [Cuscuta epithymum]|uniref:KNOX1 domain-containing protein n=1 Tax=Cuscuta epithymum TaxID=186058 RepID=A0AAV0CRU9_9ASTE|nr:unnamed protein product [Cuscuta epithymum]